MKENLKEQIQTTSNLLTQLEAEQADFQKQMTLAVNDADSSAIIALRHRADDLPVEIQAARIRLAKLHLQSDEERIPKLQAEASKFYEPIQEAIAKRDAAVLELGKLQGASLGASEDLRDVKTRIGERKRELERLIYLASPAKGTARLNLQSLLTNQS
jgi:chromosome segregation ATPase